MIIIVSVCILCLFQLVQCHSKSHDLTSECSLNPTSFTLVQQSLNKTMKAIRVHQFGGPEVLKYETNVPLPTIGKQDVLVRVKSVGINPVETYIRSGQYSRLPETPFILGGDSAGIVEEVGAEVTTFKKGNRVWTSRSNSGTYAEFTSSPCQFVHPLPDGLNFSQGAALAIPYLTAYRALITKANARPGELVLVHGASGGVGIGAVQFAKAYGMTVIGTAGTQEGIELVQQAGAHHVFNHRDDKYLDKIKELSGNKGINVVIENAAHVNLGKDLQLLAIGGRVIVIGSRGPIEVNPRDTMIKESSISGVMLFNAQESELRESHSAIQAGILNGWLQPIVGKSFPLEKASESHHDIIYGKGALGKTVLTVD